MLTANILSPYTCMYDCQQRYDEIQDGVFSPGGIVCIPISVFFSRQLVLINTVYIVSMFNSSTSLKYTKMLGNV